MSDLRTLQVITSKLRGESPAWPSRDESGVGMVRLLDPEKWSFVRRCWEHEASARPLVGALATETRRVFNIR